ncbi:L,D-transpeptidase [Thermoflavimicrobium daqui]|uniref:L,D-transpeptidase n=1 Tax=Thermoflavimicrobium daqui TaxID=2137476 RepID=A0A364K757_9BACL|nr:L,D-transpeptidase [Thermoflavimicrobium daqui]
MISLALALILLFPTSTLAAIKKSKPIYQIEVNKRTNIMYLYQNGQVIRTYQVATGKYSSPTPSGTYLIVRKVVQPSWRHIPGGIPANPLGPRWLGLRIYGNHGSIYGIHGNNNAASIGWNSTNGCIRMNNHDVIRLFRVIPSGTPVWIHRGKSNLIWRGNSFIGY